MIAGMRKFALAYPRGVRIQSLDEYKEYCYYVAGTVGYMLTDLWHEHSPSIGVAQYEALRERCRAFAEALQTVNILKDVARDAEHENSIYMPDELLRAHGSAHDTILASNRAAETRAALGTLVQLAWHDLDQATAYLAHDSAPRRVHSTVLRAAAALRLRHAARSHEQSRGARSPRGGEDLSIGGEVADRAQRARRVQQPRDDLARGANAGEARRFRLVAIARAELGSSRRKRSRGRDDRAEE